MAKGIIYKHAVPPSVQARRAERKAGAEKLQKERAKKASKKERARAKPKTRAPRSPNASPKQVRVGSDRVMRLAKRKAGVTMTECMKTLLPLNHHQARRIVNNLRTRGLLRMDGPRSKAVYRATATAALGLP